jgi:hypothetical protein
MKLSKFFTTLFLVPGLLAIENLPATASHDVVNGCTSVPDSPAGANFTPACNHHDLCYGTLGKSQSDCDSEFDKELRSICEKTFADVRRNPLGVIGTVLTGGMTLAQCYKMADSYYVAVALLPQAQTSYEDAQAHAREVAAANNSNSSPMTPVANTCSDSLACTFGYAKNSKLVASRSSPEPMEGHINWARGQSESTVIIEVLSQIRQAQFMISQSPSAQSCEAFGHLKNAALTLLRNTTEPHAGHVNWCRDRLNENNWGQVVQAVEHELISPMLGALGVSSPASERLDYTFGYAKNSRLVASSSSPEPMEGHINWALRQNPSTVKNEIFSQISQTQSIISQSPSVQSCEAFGYLKNATLTLLRNTTEPHAGHVNWCRDRLNENNWNQVVQAVEQELINPMRAALGQ